MENYSLVSVFNSVTIKAEQIFKLIHVHPDQEIQLMMDRKSALIYQDRGAIHYAVT